MVTAEKFWTPEVNEKGFITNLGTLESWINVRRAIVWDEILWDLSGELIDQLFTRAVRLGSVSSGNDAESKALFTTGNVVSDMIYLFQSTRDRALKEPR